MVFYVVVKDFPISIFNFFGYCAIGPLSTRPSPFTHVMASRFFKFPRIGNGYMQGQSNLVFLVGEINFTSIYL